MGRSFLWPWGGVFSFGKGVSFWAGVSFGVTDLNDELHECKLSFFCIEIFDPMVFQGYKYTIKLEVDRVKNLSVNI